MLDFLEWQAAAEQVTAEVLAKTGYVEGAVDALQVARRLRYNVVYDNTQSSRGRLKQIAGRTTIFLKPDERRERLQWAVSHEIGETLAYQVFEQLQVHPQEVNPGRREQVANLLASCLLLPGRDFFAQAAACQEELTVLKQRYWTASHELIALRLLDQPAPRCVTVVDQGRVTKRRGTHQQPPGPLLSVEEVCWKDTHAKSCFREHREQDLWIRCWPIHEPHWKREIVLTELER